MQKIIDNKIFGDIFEAIRRLEKNHPVLAVKENKTERLVRNSHSFNLMGLPDGTIGAFPPNMMFRFYRGENDDFDAKYPCVPQIYRVKNNEGVTAQIFSELRLIDRLKISEFELIANEFPQVRYAIKGSAKNNMPFWLLIVPAVFVIDCREETQQ